MGCLETGGTEVVNWLRCIVSGVGFLVVSRRELVLSLGVLRWGDSW